MTETLPEERRRAAFAALIAEQDGGTSVTASRVKVGKEFGITVEQMREIEKEGLKDTWPPLEA